MKAGWKTVKLGEIALVGAGNSAPQDDADFSTDGPYFVRTSDVGEVKFGTVNSSNDRLSSKGAKGMRLWKAGTILIPKSGASTFVNHRVILGLDAHVSSHLATIQAEPTRCDGRYLLYYLSTVKAQDLIQDQSYPSLKLPEIAGIEIPLPPLAEQKRIVALLDEAFASIDEAKAKAESNDEAAADLLESRLSELFLKPKESPSMISDHCTEVTVGYVGPMADKYVPNGIPFLRSQNVRPFEINFDNLMQITPAFEKSLSKSRLAPGDVVVVRTGYPGTAAVIPAELPMANCADLVILRPMKSLDPNYLVAFFNSKVGKDMVLGRLVGAAQKHFNVGAAKSVLLPIPSIQRQREVVSHIAEIRTHVGNLMDNSKGKLSELRELKTSILAQAFAGELTA